jgi:Flp pilus assembly pilin Flp
MARFDAASILVQRLRRNGWLGILQRMPLLSSKAKRSDEFRQEEDRRSFVDYTLLVVLIALVLWVALMYAKPGSALSDGWSKIAACIGDVASCSSAS